MSIFRKDIIENAVSERELCLMNPDYFIKKYILIKINTDKYKDKKLLYDMLARRLKKSCDILNIPMHDYNLPPPHFTDFVMKVANKVIKKVDAHSGNQLTLQI